MAVMVMPSSGTRLRGIEGLRGIAAFFVLCFHVMLVLRAPDQVANVVGPLSTVFAHGLTLFFVLSGFLLYRPYVQGVLSDRPIPQPKEFLRNRVLRIWPAYVVVLVAAGIILGLARVTADASGSMDSEAQALGRFTDPWMLLTNLLLVQGWIPEHMYTGLVVSWSLVTEVSFYLLLPVFGLMAVRLARTIPRIVAVAIPVALLLLVGTTGRLAILHSVAQADPSRQADLIAGPTWSAVLYRGILGQGDLFAVGMAAAVLVVAAGSESPRGTRAATWLAALAAPIGAVFVGGGERSVPFIGLFFAAGVALLLLPRPRLLPRITVQLLETLPLRAAGLCSYSVYLWHCTVIWLLYLNVEEFRYSTASGLLGCIAVTAAGTYLLAWPTYRWVELPFMERKHRPQATEPAVDESDASVVPIAQGSSRRRRVAAAAGVAAVVVGGTSVAAAQNALPAPLQRFAADTSQLMLPARFALPQPVETTADGQATDGVGRQPAAGPSDAPGGSDRPAADGSTTPGHESDPSSSGNSASESGDGEQSDPARPRTPKVDVPSVGGPDVDVPDVDVPDLPDLPDTPDVNVPDVNGRRLQVPEVDVPDAPSAEHVPPVEAETPDALANVASDAKLNR